MDFSARGRLFDRQLEETTAVWRGERAIGPAPRPGGRPGLLIGGRTDAAYQRAAAYADGWTMGGGPPAMVTQALDKLAAAWSIAGRTGSSSRCCLLISRQGHRWNDHRLVIDGIFFRTRVGCPWRDLPGRFGNFMWTVYSRHRRWSGDGMWEKILDQLRAGCEEGRGQGWTVAADATVVRAHQHAAGARRRPPADVEPARLAPVPLSALCIRG